MTVAVLLTLILSTHYLSDWDGNLTAAGAAAQPSCGTVVIDGVFDVTYTHQLKSCVTYTGGTLKRPCWESPEILAVGACLTFDIQWPAGIYTLLSDNSEGGYKGHVNIDASGCVLGTSGPLSVGGLTSPIAVGDRIAYTYTMATLVNHTGNVTIDNVTFDSQWPACNRVTNDWRLNNALAVKGPGVLVKNSQFYNMPSETLVTCGATITGNLARNLAGSFVHKSCASPLMDVITDNKVEQVNVAGNDITGHAEGAITLSANAGLIVMTNNTFVAGNEGVLGFASNEDRHITATSNTFDGFAYLITLLPGAGAETIQFHNNRLSNMGDLVVEQ